MTNRFAVLAGCAALLAVSVAAQSQRGTPLSEEDQAARRSMTIEEYVPKSTLVVERHPVPRARFPVIDVHSHQRTSMTAADWQRISGEMDGLNLRLLVNLSGGSGARLKQAIDFARQETNGRLVLFANLDFSQPIGPGYGKRAAAQLEEDVKAGAVGLKFFKNFGFDVKDVNGKRVAVDDPELDPVFEACARLNIPVLIHTGEPAAFFDPVDKVNERWLELMIHPDRRRPPDRFPRFEDLMAERDRLFLKHSKTRFIAAHFGWHANDLGRLGKMLDRMPNVYVETGAILAELGRQPRAAHAFFVKYQDRILFGKDTYTASEYPYYWQTFETADEYFDYYRNYHAFWKLYGMDLPDPVLRKVYYANALKVVPGIPPAAFPATHD